jgi:hypothetical protein
MLLALLTIAAHAGLQDELARSASLFETVSQEKEQLQQRLWHTMSDSTCRLEQLQQHNKDLSVLVEDLQLQLTSQRLSLSSTCESKAAVTSCYVWELKERQVWG